ncbi:hypothetical protein H2248_008632 [Termitomyces sp. 'cryptogamus']|nr:hypothetical protein H2248_008632 [Termitomyces sp. 'cryptogamus']
MWSLTTLLTSLSLAISTQALIQPRFATRPGPITPSLHVFSPRDTTHNETSRTGITPVTLSSDKQSYYALLDVGAITFRVALDSASSDLWIISSDCSTKTCDAVPRYPLSYQSPTYVTTNGNSTPFIVRYLDGTVASGFVAKESVSLTNLTVTNQAFGMVTKSNVTMVDETSGILGLGFPRLSSIPSSVTNATPFLIKLVQQGLLEYPVFGLSLTRNSTGTLSLGAVDSSLVKNASLISWNQVVDFAPFGAESNSSSYLQWTIPISAVAINGTQIKPSSTYPNITGNMSLALFDLGTPGIYGPIPDVARLFSTIDGARLVEATGQWAVPCDTVEPLLFTFGTQNYTLQPSDYIIGPASGNPNLCLSWPHGSPPSADGIDWQIGTAFLRTVYSIFSYGINSKEPPLIGLYPLHNTTDSQETPDSLSSVFSSLSATIATTLPNFLLPTPTYTTPPYAFNTSVSHLPNGIATSGLATSTYRPIIGTRSSVNVTVLPGITPTPSLVTFIITNSVGSVVTTTSTVAEPSVKLGVPPGWNAGILSHTTSLMAVFLGSIMSWLFINFSSAVSVL